jgi:serum response factor
MLLVASETGHVYTFATRKLQPMITSDAGKALIQTCLNSPDPPQSSAPSSDQRMSASGYEETELTYNAITDAAAAAAAEAAEQQKVRQMMYNSHHYPLFSPGGGTPVSSHGGVAAPPTSMSMGGHSPYNQPAPSPSPHQVGGVSTTSSGHAPSSSYSPSHHSPPFLGSGHLGQHGPR